MLRKILLLLAPVVFVAHFLEEGPAFVAWFNAHVARDITEPLFWTVNVIALVLTVSVVVIEWLMQDRVSAVLATAWLSFLMAANALFHLAGALRDRAYMPGLVTALALYLPFYVWVVATILRTRRLGPAATAAAALIGALPMVVHGYLIVFRGSRLF